MIVYTFRTFPWIDQLKKTYPDLQVFGSLKKDLKKLEEKINRSDSTKILIGVARGQQNRMEMEAVNNFQDRKINRSGRQKYKLWVPKSCDFKRSLEPSNTFCNWTMYKISEFISGSNRRLAFFHVNELGLTRLISHNFFICKPAKDTPSFGECPGENVWIG